MKPQVLVTKRVYPEAVELLRRHVEVDYVDSDDGLTAADLAARVRGKQAIVSQLTDRFDAKVIESLDGVRSISNVAVGFDNIDVGAATRKKILVTNTPDVLTDTTADFAFALLMAAARRVVEGHQYVHSGTWRKWYMVTCLSATTSITPPWAFSVWAASGRRWRNAQAAFRCASCITMPSARSWRLKRSWGSSLFALRATAARVRLSSACHVPLLYFPKRAR